MIILGQLKTRLFVHASLCFGLCARAKLFNKLAIIDDLNDVVDMKSEILREYEKKFVEPNSKEAKLYSGKFPKTETDSFILKRNKLKYVRRFCA